MLPAQPPQLTTERLVLEPLEERHAALAFDAVRDARMYRYIPHDGHPSCESLRRRYARMHAGPAAAEQRWWNWALARWEYSSRAIGTVETSLTGSERASLAYGIGPAHWGRGYAYEACVAVIARLRVATKLSRIDAYIDTRNARSIALVERLGFIKLETIAAADFKGASSDEYRYTLVLRS